MGAKPLGQCCRTPQTLPPCISSKDHTWVRARRTAVLPRADSAARMSGADVNEEGVTGGYRGPDRSV